jgi:hypothetical protein
LLKKQIFPVENSMFLVNIFTLLKQKSDRQGHLRRFINNIFLCFREDMLRNIS